jgi:hypothetical protein
MQNFLTDKLDQHENSKNRENKKHKNWKFFRWDYEIRRN